MSRYFTQEEINLFAEVARKRRIARKLAMRDIARINAPKCCDKCERVYLKSVGH